MKLRDGRDICLCTTYQEKMKATKHTLTTPDGREHSVARLVVPYWMDSRYRGREGTRAHRKRIKRLVEALHGMPNTVSSSESDTTPSPPSSDQDQAADTDEDPETPDTDECLGIGTTDRKSSTMSSRSHPISD